MNKLRLNHFILLTGVLLIALFTSGMKAMATTQTVNFTGDNVSKTTSNIEPADGTEITVSPGTGFKITGITSVVVAGETETTLDATADYAVTPGESGTSVITLTSAGAAKVTDAVTVTATAEALSNDATLSSLKYKIGSGEEITVPDFTAATESYTLVIEPTKEASVIVSGELTDANAKITTHSAANFSNLVATPTIVVTAEDGSTSKTYTVTVKQKVTFTLADTENCNLTAEATDNVTIKLTAAEGYALPAAITMNNGGGDLEQGAENEKYQYSDGTITLGASVVASSLTITATGVSTDATLKTMSYTLGGGDPVEIKANEDGNFPTALTIPYSAETTVTLGGEVNDEEASITTPSAATFTNLEATATINVTAADKKTTKEYSVTFTKQDKVANITAPTVGTLTARAATAADAIKLLDTEEYKASIIGTIVSEAVEKAVTWTYNKEKNASAEYNPATGAKNKFTWTVDVADYDKNLEAVSATGEVEVTNMAAETDATITSLTYAVDGGENTAVTVGDQSSADIACTITGVAFNAKKVILSVTPKSAFATVAQTVETLAVTSTPLEVALNATGNTEFKFTVTAEDGTAKKNFTVTITKDAEKVTKVEVPAKHLFEAKVADVETALKALTVDVKATIETNGATVMTLVWSYNKAKNSNAEYAINDGKTYNFT